MPVQAKGHIININRRTDGGYKHDAFLIVPPLSTWGPVVYKVGERFPYISKVRKDNIFSSYFDSYYFDHVKPPSRRQYTFSNSHAVLYYCDFQSKQDVDTFF